VRRGIAGRQPGPVESGKNIASANSVWPELEHTLATDRKTLVELIEAATKAAYEARRVRTGGEPWAERTAEERRRFIELVTAAFNHLPAMGFAITRAADPDAVPGVVTLPIEQARHIWAVISGGHTPAAQSLAAIAALQNAIAKAESVPA
jgi:hypothetical protein